MDFRITEAKVAVAVSLLVIAIAGGAWLGGWGNFSSQESPEPRGTVNDVPEEVESVQPLANAFYQHIAEYYPDSRVFITGEGQIVMEFSPDANSGEGVKRELMQIALEYSAVVNRTGYNATTLSVVTGQVEAVVPEPTVQEHAEGNLTDKAFSKTIEVRSIETETTES